MAVHWLREQEYRYDIAGARLSICSAGWRERLRPWHWLVPMLGWPLVGSSTSNRGLTDLNDALRLTMEEQVLLSPIRQLPRSSPPLVIAYERQNCPNPSVSRATITIRVAMHTYPPSCYQSTTMITFRFLRRWPIQTASSPMLWFDWRPVETTYVRFWHLASFAVDAPFCPLLDQSGQSRFWLAEVCPLLTQSGHQPLTVRHRKKDGA